MPHHGQALRGTCRVTRVIDRGHVLCDDATYMRPSEQSESQGQREQWVPGAGHGVGGARV